MQDFTLGKKGYSMLLFALILLIGSSPTFGQTNCPTVSNSSQNYCYLKTVADLNATANGDGVRWYRNATSNTAIPSNELLQDGTYFAGNNSGNCTNRVPVSVTVDDIGAPTADFGNTYAPCEYSPGGTSTVQDLIASVNGNSVEIYDKEYSGSPLAPATPLIEGNSYFAGQRNPTTNCPSSRLALRYDPVLALAPTADPVQVFCPGATVKDLMAQATSTNTTAFRWYSTSTSNPQLSEDTPLINGESYYASQIVNRQSSPLPPCESRDRAEVIVEFQSVTPEESTQVFCVNSDDPSSTPKVEDLVSPYSTPFFADSNFTQLLDSQTDLANGEDYFTANGDPNSCESTRVTVSFVEIPNAGGDVNEQACQTEFSDSNALLARFSSLLLDRDLGGSFSNVPALVAQFDSNPIGVFTTTYTVTTGTCTDFANITVTVIEATPAEAGNIDNFEVCTNDAAITLSSLLSEDATPGGTFTNSNGDEITTFDPQTASLGDNDFTYTVNGSTETCTTGSDSEPFTITVNQAPNAGENFSRTYCLSEINTIVSNQQDFIDLFNSFVSSADPNGDFSPSLQTLADNFTADPIGTFSTTYTVSNNDCSDSSEISITVNEEAQPANAGTIDDFEVCTNDDEIELSSLLSDDATPGGTFTDSNNDEITSFDPQTAGAGNYEFTYTVNGSTETCTTGADTESFTITTNQAPNSGANVNVEVCETELTDSASLLARFSALLTNRDLGGDFSNIPALTAQYTANPIGVFTTTYTVTNSNCSDSADITITVIKETPAEAGTIEDFEICSNDDPIVLSTLISADATPGGTFTNSNNDDVTSFNPQTSGVGDFEFTYTVNGSTETCTSGSDSETFTITVNQAPDAGIGASQEYCESEINQLVSNQQDFKDLFNALIVNSDPNGSFSPSLQSLADAYTTNQIGVFSTNYTVSNSNCSDSTTFTIIVKEETEANAGAPVFITFCVSENNDFTLTDFLADDVNPLGTFEAPFESGVFNPSTLGVGVFTFDYTVDNTIACVNGSSTSNFTITILDINNANAGADQTANFCVSENQDIDLISLIDPNASPTGSFSTPYANGKFNPAQSGAGEYTITYTVEGPRDCAIGIDRATITITVNEAADAPTADANQSFCLADGPTVGDIVVTGSNVVIYTNSDLTDEADATTTLVNGMSYYATSTSEGETCSSDAIEITVTITDPAAPSLSLDGNEFCRSDNPTVQALVNNFSGGVVIYNASTGGTSIQANTPLQNGTTYYAAAINATSGCESSERTAVIAKVEFCGIPEGFSPNGDGINDRFVIPDIAENFPNYTIEIFNRWGQVVFKGNSSTPDWDGISNQSGTLGNDVLPVGVYFYILNYNDGQTSPVQGKLYLSI